MAEPVQPNPALTELIKMFAGQRDTALAGVQSAQSGLQSAIAAPMPEAPPPDFGNPLASFLSSFAGNLATGISGNPNYQQNANNLIGQQRQEAKQTAREKLHQLLQQRSEFLAEKMDDLKAQREAAREAGDNVLRAELAAATDKTQREQLKLQESIATQETADRAAGRAIDEKRASIDAGQLKLQQLAYDLEAAKAGFTSDPKTNAIINHRIRFNNVNENIKNIINASKGKIKDEKTVFKKFPGLKTEYDAALGSGLAPLKGEQAQEYIDRRVAAGLPVDKVVAAAKAKWPNEDWSQADEVVGASTSPDQSISRLNALISGLSGVPFPANFNPALTGVAGMVGAAGQGLSLPLNAGKWLNEPLVPDTTKGTK